MTELNDEYAKLLKRQYEDGKKALAREAWTDAYRCLRAAKESILENEAYATLSEQSRVCLAAAFMVSMALAEIAVEVKGLSPVV
jgi:hypothetical protein